MSIFTTCVISFNCATSVLLRLSFSGHKQQAYSGQRTRCMLAQRPVDYGLRRSKPVIPFLRSAPAVRIALHCKIALSFSVHQMTAISTDFCHDIKRLSRPSLAAIASHSLRLFVYVDGSGTIELQNSFTVTYFTTLAMFCCSYLMLLY